MFEIRKKSEECFKLCSSENRHTGVKGGVKHKKGQYDANLNRMN